METVVLKDYSPDGMFTDFHAEFETNKISSVYFGTSLEPKPLPEDFITSDAFDSADGEIFLRFNGRPERLGWNGGVYLRSSNRNIQKDVEFFNDLLKDVGRISICDGNGQCAGIKVSGDISPSVSVPDPG